MADIVVSPGGSYDTSIDWGAAGLVGTIGVRLVDGNGATFAERVTGGIREWPSGSGRYEFTRTAPTTQGDYQEFWDDGSVTPGHVANGDSVRVTSSLAGSVLPTGRDLCTLADVVALVPGYTSDVSTDALLSTIITAESRSAHQSAGREFVSIAGQTERDFDVDGWSARNRRVRVGDMTSVSSVTIEDIDGVTLETVGASDRVSLGQSGNRTRDDWEPIMEIWFPPTVGAASLAEGYVVEVEGVWGFPAIPADLVVAVAKLVLVRYVADAANAGTALSDALNEQGFDAGVAFVSAREVVRSYQWSRFA